MVVFYKQFINFGQRTLVFMQTLTENLYSENLANNASVCHRLIDDGKEEECKEAMLADLFLWAGQLSLVEIDSDGLINLCDIDKARDSGP